MKVFEGSYNTTYEPMERGTKNNKKNMRDDSRHEKRRIKHERTVEGTYVKPNVREKTEINQETVQDKSRLSLCQEIQYCY